MGYRLTYSVRTWSEEDQAYTPQIGLSTHWEGLNKSQLRIALKELRRLGYPAHRTRSPEGDHDDNDWAVLVERSDQQTNGER